MKDSENNKEDKKEYFEEEFGADRRTRIDLEAGYGRRTADHPIRCLDCGLMKKMFWKLNTRCPRCNSKRFYPMIFVEDLDEATGKSKKTLFELLEKRVQKIKRQVLARYKIWLIYILAAVNIGVWGRFLILNVEFLKTEYKFEWPRFYHCQDCRKYFSRTLQDDVGRARCRYCRSIKVERIEKKRIAR